MFPKNHFSSRFKKQSIIRLHFQTIDKMKRFAPDDSSLDEKFLIEFGEKENTVEYYSNVETTKHTIKRKANDTIGDRYTFILSFVCTIFQFFFLRYFNQQDQTKLSRARFLANQAQQN